MLYLGLLLVLVPVSSQYLNLTESVGNILGNPCTDKNHIVLAPGVLTAGGTNRACVSRFYPEGPARVLLTLLTEDRKTTTASRDLPSGDGGCLDINVPQLPNTKADLIVNIRYPEAQCVWERRLSLRVSSGRVLVVQAERAKYRPGDTVRVRIMALKSDLTPSHGSIEEIWLEGPHGAWEGSRVAQWLQVRTRLGLAQLQYQLDKLAPPGKWTLRARLGDGSQGSAVFSVGNYELPPFQLSVRHSPRVLRSSERLSWIVCVRYPWSEAVEGMLVIRLRGAGGEGAGGGVRTAVQLRAPKACHRHSVAAKRVGLHSRNPPQVLVADFSFQEDGTRIWQNTTVVSQVVDNAITLEFLTKHRAVISPGLPYKLKVKATRWDDKPAAGEHIRVCRYPALQPEELVRSEGDSTTSQVTPQHLCTHGETDNGGVAAIMFAPIQDESAYYKFEAQLVNASGPGAALWVGAGAGAGAGGGAGRGAGRVHAALGPVRAPPSRRALVPLYVSAHLAAPLTVHFVVITRGGIIYRWGATTQCPTSNNLDHISVAQRNSKCNDNYYGYNQELKIQSNQMNNNDDIARRTYNPYRRPARVNENMMTKRYIAHELWNISGNNPYNFHYDQSPINKFEINNYDNPSLDHLRTVPENVRIIERYANVPNIGRTDQYWRNSGKNDDDFTESTSDRVMNGADVTSDALLERKLKVLLPIKVSHQMCPESHLIAYFYYNGELVSASKHLEMEDCFANKVEATWLTRQAQPGATVSLQISSPGPALCALTVLDTASRWLQSPPTTRELVMNGLRRLMDSRRNLTEYDAAGECFFNSDTPATPSSSIELTSSWLAAAGVRMLGGEAPRQAVRRCEAAPVAEMLTDNSAPRSDFSEAWLWRLLPVGANGTGVASAKAPDSITRFEAAATCVSRTGIAVSTPAILQVFREFFIHADSPKRLRRGDTGIVRYRIFNYLYEPLSVQIQVLTDPHMEVSGALVETACVGARSSVARRAVLRARVAAPARVSLRARTVADDSCQGVNTTASVSDEVIIRIDVEPEGVPVREERSILLCGHEPRQPDQYNSSGIDDRADSGPSSVEWKWNQVEMVPGTEVLSVWTTGDVTGPLLADADSLVMIPRGCGEQNMAQLATNLLALQHLEPSSLAALTAREHVARGLSRQLQYVAAGGGFSAFGAADPGPSSWLSAFAVRYLRRAHRILWPNLQVPPAVIRAERWLLNQQMENGCFRNEGQVFHRELRGGLNEEGEIASVALTAYVITALIESTSHVPYRVLRNSLACLRALPPIKSPTRVYAHALLAYAYMALENYEEDLRKTNQLSLFKGMNLQQDEGISQVLELLKLAKRSGDFVWWEASSLSSTIEATSYALLALRRAGVGGQEAAAARRWLASHRSVGGGFVSTQDTLVALEALTAWSTGSPMVKLNVTARSHHTAQTIVLRPGERLPHIMSVPPSDKLTVDVQGSGCALVQATRSYNVVSGAQTKSQDKLLSVQVSVHTDGPFDCDHNNTNCYCAAIVEACVMWTSRFPEMALLEVSLPGGYGADAQLLYAQLHKTDTLLRRIELTPSNSRASVYLGPRAGAELAAGHACYRVPAVGPRASTRPAYVRLQDYYAPEHNDTQQFTIPEDCPPRIVNDVPQYHSSDNLFTKAKSLDSDEILITEEFTFEDIPDGIPLEDPLYDNLTKREKTGEVENANESDNNTTINNESNRPTESYNNIEIGNITKNKLNITDHTTDSSVNNEENNENLKPESDNFNKDIILDHLNYKEDGTRNEADTITNTNIKNIETPKDIAKDKEVTIKNSYDNIEHTTELKAISENIVSQPISMIPTNNEKVVENPKLSDFHVIDSDKDLDVPSGIEGPIAAVVLPPINFVPPNHDYRLKTAYTTHGLYRYYEPERRSARKRYFIPSYNIHYHH